MQLYTINDPLYGTWSPPPIVAELIETALVQRLRGVTMAVVPNDLMPYGPIPSRLEHCMGVAYGMWLALAANHAFLHVSNDLLAAAILHDAGNTPFAHLGEAFLRKLYNLDGETHLAALLIGSSAEDVLKQFNVDPARVIRLVCGQVRPLGDVLHGSMDVDNLDNVARYHLAANLGPLPYDPTALFRAFRYTGASWSLTDDAWDGAMAWRKARETTYASIYGAAHLCVAMMAHRALEFAWHEEKLTRGFFHLSDTDALDYLRTRCGSAAQGIVEDLLLGTRYTEVFSAAWDGDVPLCIVTNGDATGRGMLADAVAERLGIPPASVCAYIGKGRDRRRITLPFVSETGGTRYDERPDPPVWRIRVFVHPADAARIHNAKEIIERILGLT